MTHRVHPANGANVNRIIPLILAVALFMEQLDSTVIATALPAIAADIGTSPIALKLALTSYYVALAVFIPISGWMADRFGAKQVFVAAIAVFMVGSVACAFAGSLGGFVASRFLQGMGGAMMTPVARLVLVRGVPREDLVSAMAWLTIPALIGPLAGPPIGGFIATYFSWHWIFLVNIPIGIAGIAATLRFLPPIASEPPGRLDIAGFFLAGIAAAGLIFGFSVVSLPALPFEAGVAAMVIGFVSLLLYIRHARRVAEPLLALSLMQNRVFAATIIGGSLFRVGIGAMPFLTALMLQLSFGLTPFESGMVTFIGAVGAISMKFFAKSTFARHGFRTVLLATGFVSGATLLAMAGFGNTTPFVFLYVLLLAGGFSRSLFFTGLNALSFSSISAREAAQATAFSAVMQQLSIAAGVAIAGAVLEAATHLQGRDLALVDFHIAFAVVAIINLAGMWWFWKLKPTDGADTSGHRLASSGQADTGTIIAVK